MKSGQIYCTANEVAEDMGRDGNSRAVFKRMGAASTTIRQNIGNFIPITETKKFVVTRRNQDEQCIYVPALLSCSTLKIEDVTINASYFELQPVERQWDNGPYIKIEFDDEAAIFEDDEIEITGKWGLYEASEETGLTASQTTATETTLTATDASPLSVGMALLIEDEQELITAGQGGEKSPSPTAATSKVNGAIVSTDEIIVVDNGSEFHAGEVIQIESEDLLIRKISGNSLTVERGWNSTASADHADDKAISVYRTFTVTRGVNGTTAAAHSSKAVSILVPPEDVNWLCRQITGLMIMKAASGFQGRTGNAETGESGFYSEFPPNQMAEIKRHYPNLE